MSRTIQDIYDAYTVMPSLQLHMLRVTAVAKTICENRSGEKISKKRIMTSCFLHDMGNILKFDLALYPKFLEPEGLEYRQGVKESYKKFGSDEQIATVAIAKEIGLDNDTLYLLTKQAVESPIYRATCDDIELKICEFADMSVNPHGFIYWHDRINDLGKRIIKNHNLDPDVAKKLTDERLDRMIVLEKELAQSCPSINKIHTMVDVGLINELRKYIV